MKTFDLDSTGKYVRITDGTSVTVLDAAAIHALSEDQYRALLWSVGGYVLSTVMLAGGFSRPCPPFPQKDDADSERDGAGKEPGFGPVEPPAKKYRHAELLEKIHQFFDTYGDDSDESDEAADARLQIMNLLAERFGVRGPQGEKL
jgi:hypothetical protein